MVKCRWCGAENNTHQAVDNTCICGRPPLIEPQYLVEVGVIAPDLKASTYLSLYFVKPSYLVGRGCTLFDLHTKEPLRLRGGTLHCDRDGRLYQYRNDLT